MILVDSSVWSHYFKGTIMAQSEMLDGVLGREPLANGDLMLKKVLPSFADERAFNQARKMLTSLTIVALGTESRESRGEKLPGTALRVGGRQARVRRGHEGRHLS